jgi:predicted CopG family antitoxin
VAADCIRHAYLTFLHFGMAVKNRRYFHRHHIDKSQVFILYFISFVYLFVYTRIDMKTITLDEAAYERLKAWKKGSRESFSSVVKRVIPEPGTLGAFLSHVQAAGNHDHEKDDLMEETINDRSVIKEEPWT